MSNQFSCNCDSRYVGRNFQRLQDRTKQHVSKSIRSCFFSQKRVLPTRLCKFFLRSPGPSLLLLVQPLDFIFCKILRVLITTMAVDYLFLIKQGRSRFHLSALRLLTSKLLTPLTADKKNSCSA